MAEEHVVEKMDLFQLGVYAIEVALVAAIIYGLIVLPSMLKPLS
ncbi:MAG: hypothetical protein QUS07_00345 [Methanothrix sp.]|nr:hypothetical protein [Methanothrix sp.]